MRKKSLLYAVIILTLIALDQFSKWLVVKNLDPWESIPLIGIFKITYAQNTGAAFSMLTGNTVFLLLLTLLFLALLVIFWQKPFMTPYHLTIVVIVGGTLGNFIDRLCRGYVVDMFDFTYFPVFNVADITLCCGVGVLILQILLAKDEKNSAKNDNNN